MLVFGRNVAIEMLQSGTSIRKIYLKEKFNDEEILKLINKRGLYYVVKSKYDMDRMVDGVNQGIILEVADYKYSNIEEILDLESSLVVALDHLSDPHNFGAIIRTCEAAGVDAIIIPKDRSISVNGTVVKTSVGTVNKVKIIQVTNLVNTLKKLKDNGYWVVGTDMNGTNYTEIDYTGKTVIICGNEGFGMSKLVSDNCDFIASIPMRGEVNSLNASVATAIIVFEAMKKRL